MLYIEACLLESYYYLIGDGYCSDELNHADCDFDGGDCCLTDKPFVDYYCEECTCHM